MHSFTLIPYTALKYLCYFTVYERINKPLLLYNVYIKHIYLECWQINIKENYTKNIPKAQTKIF